jgi:hypothetical protein
MAEITKHEHVVPRGDEWAVTPAGAERATKKFPTRKEALKYAKDLATKHQVCMVVHDEEGKFEEFDCEPDVGNQHVVRKGENWGVVEEGGRRVVDTFPTRSEALSHAYQIAAKHKVCMLVHDDEGKFHSEICPPEGKPGIIEVIKTKMGM